jgi:serine/threonine-protein kinase
MTVMLEELDFGPYRLLAKVGQGPRGPVFVAQVNAAQAADSLYLVEVSGFATGEDEPLRGFVRDTENAARIQHRNVLGIVERGASAGGHYLVMPYLDSATLAELQDRDRAVLPPRLVIAAVIDALHGLHAAHSFRRDGVAQPLIHGSVSPAQVVIGLDGVCRIAGFGAARPRVQTKPSHRSTAATPYLSPEQVRGGDLDPRSDLFAVGVVLWNALTGKKLFHDPLEHMAMANVLERKVPPPSRIGLTPPPALDGFVLKALERDPAQRFQSAAEMAGARRRARRGLPGDGRRARRLDRELVRR